MTEISAVQSASTAATKTNHPYAPSLFDRFIDLVDSLSIPGWLFYAVFAAILVGIQFLIQWNGGTTTVSAFPLAYIITIAYGLGLMHHLDTAAEQSLKRFRPLMTISDAEYDELRYRLTTLPALPTLIAAAIGAFDGVIVINWIPDLIKVQELHFADNVLSLNFNNVISLIVWAIVGVLVYHSLHQLRIVQQIYNRHPNVDLYNLRPLYAFSTLSAQTAVGIALIVYLWYLFAPLLFNIGLAGLLFFTGLALLTFVLPLWGARRLLVEEKDRRLTENGKRQRSAIAELHRRVDENELMDMDNLNKAIAGLESEQTALNRISTWPWKPETPRAVSAALLFPIIIWLMQWLLKRILES